MKGLTYSIAHAVFAVGILLAWAHCPAQKPTVPPPHSITIYMLNGKTGRPMRNKYIRAKFPDDPQRTTIRVDSRGFGHLQIPAGVKAFSLSAPRTGKRHPHPAYTVCGPFNDLIPVRDVLAHGYVPLDACSPTLRLRASPGVLLYFAQPLPWYPPSRE